MRLGPAVRRMAWAAFIGLAGCSSGGVAAVETGSVVAPTDAVPAEIRAYSGVWKGKWDGTWDAVIVVRQVDAQGHAVVQYRWTEQAGGPFLTDADGRGRISHGELHYGTITLKIDPANSAAAHGTVKTPSGERSSDFAKLQ